jgi:hypothetical protein
MAIDIFDHSLKDEFEAIFGLVLSGSRAVFSAYRAQSVGENPSWLCHDQ